MADINSEQVAGLLRSPHLTKDQGLGEAVALGAGDQDSLNTKAATE